MTKPTGGLEMYANVIRERDDAREELARLRKSLESMATRWEGSGGANGGVWRLAGESLRIALQPKPETVGSLLQQLQHAAIDRDEPLDREFLLETVGKLAKLLSTP